MDEKLKREYQRVILGVLLHDIGKFTVKQFPTKEHEHPWYSEEFIENNLSYIKDRNLVDFKELVEKAKAVKQVSSDIHWFDWKRFSTRQEEWMSFDLKRLFYENLNEHCLYKHRFE